MQRRKPDTFIHYWEGWTVLPNNKSTEQCLKYGYDDQTTGYPGQTVTKSARFYEGQALPASFVATGQPPGGGLPVTFIDPKMSTENATPPVTQSETF